MPITDPKRKSPSRNACSPHPENLEGRADQQAPFNHTVYSPEGRPKKSQGLSHPHWGAVVAKPYRPTHSPPPPPLWWWDCGWNSGNSPLLCGLRLLPLFLMGFQVGYKTEEKRLAPMRSPWRASPLLGCSLLGGRNRVLVTLMPPEQPSAWDTAGA